MGVCVPTPIWARSAFVKKNGAWAPKSVLPRLPNRRSEPLHTTLCRHAGRTSQNEVGLTANPISRNPSLGNSEPQPAWAAGWHNELPRSCWAREPPLASSPASSRSASLVQGRARPWSKSLRCGRSSRANTYLRNQPSVRVAYASCANDCRTWSKRERMKRKLKNASRCEAARCCCCGQCSRNLQPLICPTVWNLIQARNSLWLSRPGKALSKRQEHRISRSSVD